jgi:hypothetical protein
MDSRKVEHLRNQIVGIEKQKEKVVFKVYLVQKGNEGLLHYLLSFQMDKVAKKMIINNQTQSFDF